MGNANRRPANMEFAGQEFGARADSGGRSRRSLNAAAAADGLRFAGCARPALMMAGRIPRRGLERAPRPPASASNLFDGLPVGRPSGRPAGRPDGNERRRAPASERDNLFIVNGPPVSPLRQLGAPRTGVSRRARRANRPETRRLAHQKRLFCRSRLMRSSWQTSSRLTCCGRLAALEPAAANAVRYGPPLMVSQAPKRPFSAVLAATAATAAAAKVASHCVCRKLRLSRVSSQARASAPHSPHA